MMRYGLRLICAVDWARLRGIDHAATIVLGRIISAALSTGIRDLADKVLELTVCVSKMWPSSDSSLVWLCQPNSDRSASAYRSYSCHHEPRGWQSDSAAQRSRTAIPDLSACDRVAVIAPCHLLDEQAVVVVGSDDQTEHEAAAGTPVNELPSSRCRARIEDS
jgi:hypothetical protein